MGAEHTRLAAFIRTVIAEMQSERQRLWQVISRLDAFIEAARGVKGFEPSLLSQIEDGVYKAKQDDATLFALASFILAKEFQFERATATLEEGDSKDMVSLLEEAREMLQQARQQGR